MISRNYCINSIREHIGLSIANDLGFILTIVWIHLLNKQT